MEQRLKEYRALRRRRELIDNAKDKIEKSKEKIVNFLILKIFRDMGKVNEDEVLLFNTEYKTKRLWYLANQFILTPVKEAAYFADSAELSFKVHTLEVTLTRHRDLSGPRFRVMMDYWNKHPLLKEYNRLTHRSNKI